jgi:hypothetical protein
MTDSSEDARDIRCPADMRQVSPPRKIRTGQTSGGGDILQPWNDPQNNADGWSGVACSTAGPRSPGEMGNGGEAIGGH